MSVKTAVATVEGKLARGLNVRAEALRAEVYGTLERNKIGRGRTYSWRAAKPGETPDYFVRGAYGNVFPVKERAKPHRASAPGDPPARDIGKLQESIAVLSRATPSNLEASVGPRPESFTGLKPYPAYLEFGTPAMKPRPFMRPSLNTFREKVRGVQAKWPGGES